MANIDDFMHDLEQKGRLRGIGEPYFTQENIQRLKDTMLQTAPALEHWPALKQIMNELMSMYPLQSALQLIGCLFCAYWKLYGNGVDS